MDLPYPEAFLVGAFFYLILFGFLIVADVVVGLLLLRAEKVNHTGSSLARLTIAAPIIGYFAYLSIDFFETKSLAAVWWVGMLALLITPLTLSLLKLRKVDKTNLTQAKK